MGVAVAIWVITGVFAVIWLKGYTQGPAEWLLRRLAYGKPDKEQQPGPDGTLATA